MSSLRHQMARLARAEARLGGAVPSPASPRAVERNLSQRKSEPETDWDAWDRQIERDCAAGRFDNLIAEIEADHRAGRTAKL